MGSGWRRRTARLPISALLVLGVGHPWHDALHPDGTGPPGLGAPELLRPERRAGTTVPRALLTTTSPMASPGVEPGLESEE
jgi:hypothetical protein